MSTAEEVGFYESCSEVSLLFLSPMGMAKLDWYFRGNK